uniref:Ampulexin 2 n=1 Tax=Ampulex compressa TaxID=860918 RepID=AMPU2_AMPCP|nr:RecName: Full=Ampulexin 2; Short=Axn2; Flags: Precursor [Ampulex compressa]ARK19788.1 ampulexin 2 [Ampulex compressa]AUX80732.1 ampulexin 2 [Ampulex compressa]
MKAIMVLFYVMTLTIIGSFSMVSGSPGQNDYVNPKLQFACDLLQKAKERQ